MSEPKKTMPTRHLLGPKPHRYVPASHTDIRRTFAVFQRLQRMTEKAR